MFFGYDSGTDYYDSDYSDGEPCLPMKEKFGVAISMQCGEL